MANYVFLDVSNQCLFTPEHKRIELTKSEFKLLLILSNNEYISFETMEKYSNKNNKYYWSTVKNRLFKKIKLNIDCKANIGYKLLTDVFII